MDEVVFRYRARQLDVQDIRLIRSLISKHYNRGRSFISLIESGPIVKKILVHLDLWDTPNHDPPTQDEKNVSEQVYDGSQSQIPPYEYWQ